MQKLQHYRFELFLGVLAAVELASVAAAHVPHQSAALAATGLSVLVLAGSRREPLGASVAAFAALTVSVAVMPQATVAQFFGTLVTFAVAGAVNRERRAVVAWLAGAAMLAYSAWVDPFGGGAPDFFLSLAFCTVMWGAGLLVARRGRHVASALARAEEATSLSHERARQAVAEERAAIARELHDVVSHGLSVVVVQAVAARTLLSDLQDPAAAGVDRHLEAVESTARDALDEMRRMLGLLRSVADDDDEVMDPPAPGLENLHDMVERVTEGRGRLQVRHDLNLQAGLELAVYRIVQEGLTNVVKHAPGAESVVVTVDEDGGRLIVDVSNGPGRGRDASGPVGAGRGLVGARERVDLYGGTLDAGPTEDGGFRLRARLPLPDATPVVDGSPAQSAVASL